MCAVMNELLLYREPKSLRHFDVCLQFDCKQCGNITKLDCKSTTRTISTIKPFEITAVLGVKLKMNIKIE